MKVVDEEEEEHTDQKEEVGGVWPAGCLEAVRDGVVAE